MINVTYVMEMVVFFVLLGVFLFVLFKFPGFRSLLGTAIVSVVVTIILAVTGVLGSIPYLGSLFKEHRIVSIIATIIFGTTLWCFGMLFVRWLKMRRELLVAKKTKMWLEKIKEKLRYKDLKDYVGKIPKTKGSLIRSSLELLLRNYSMPLQANRLLSQHAAIEAARLESIYGPIRAGVWALPALGFMGTAVGMARAISSIKGVLGNTANDQLRTQLANTLVPSLASAFNITLFALALCVVCFVLLALMYRQEEEVLAMVDMTMLTAVSQFEVDARYDSDSDLSSVLSQQARLLEAAISKALSPLQDELRHYARNISEFSISIIAELKLLNEGISLLLPDKEQIFTNMPDKERSVTGAPI